MPQRLIEIFDDSKTDVAERYKKIASCDYQDALLNDAEHIEIRLGSFPINDDELLARIVESPSHADETGKFYKDQAFAEAFKRGISVQRHGLTTASDIHRFGNEKVQEFNSTRPKEKHRKYLGYVLSLCSVFREAKSTEGQRLFGVFSTPEPGVPAHADIFVVIRPNPSEKLAIQQRFHDFFKLDGIVASPINNC